MNHPASNNLQHPLEGVDVGSSPPAEGDHSSSDIGPPISTQAEECREDVISSSALLHKYRMMLDVPSRNIWGLHIRAGMVTLFVGETSAGKTTFLQNLAYHLAKGEEFLGLTPPQPIRVLYVDYETPADVAAEHLATIGTAEGWDFMNLDIEGGQTDGDGKVANDKD
jgi:RecA-family ATPase